MKFQLPVSFRITRFIISLGILLVMVTTILVGSLLTWIAIQPRSLKTFLPMDIRLQKVEVRTPQGEIFATFPKVSLGLDILSLFVGKVTPQSLVIQHPVLSLYQQPDKSISFGFKKDTEEPAATQEPTQTAPIAVLLSQFLNQKSGGQFSRLDYIAIRDADMSIGDTAQGVFFNASQFNLSLTRGRNYFRVSFDFDMAYGDTASTIKGEMVRKRGQDTYEGRVELRNILPSALGRFFTEDPSYHGLDVPVSAVVSLQMKSDGKPVNARFALNGGKGTIAHPQLEHKLEIGSIETDGSYNFLTQQLAISHLAMMVEGATVNVSGNATLTPKQESATITGVMTNAKGDDVRKFWPLGASPVSREWVTSNISGGSIPQATINMKVPAGAFQLPALPDDSVDARLTMQDAKVRYLPDHPPLTKVKGSVHVTGQTLTVDAESAETLKQTHIAKSRFYIADLNADNPHIQLGFDVSSSGQDLADFMALPRFTHLKNLNLASPSLTGSANGHVELEFDFYAPKDAQGKSLDPDIRYAITGNLQNAGVNRFMNKFDIAQASGKMAINNDEVNFEGQGVVNKVPLDAKVRYVEIPKEGIDTFVDFKAKAAPVAALESFGVKKLDGFTGDLDAEGTIKSGDRRTEIDAKGNVAATSIEIAEVGLKKPAGVPGTLTVNVVMEDGKPVEIKSFDLVSDKIKAKGSASVSDDFNKSGRAEFTDLKTEKSDAALIYENKNGMRTLVLTGKSFDATQLMQGNSDFSFEHFPATDLTLDIGRIVLGEGRELGEVKGKLYCSAVRCERADIKGAAGTKPFSFQIGGGAGKRVLNMVAEDAGGLLHSLDLMEGIEGGVLNFDGRYTDRPDGSQLDATLRMRDYTVGNAPVLAKLLTLASLTGIVDTLQGKGIAFSKLSAPITLVDDVITIKDGKTHGSAMGMTAEGTISFPGSVLDIKGTVVPSYAMNTVLGNVPIVGQVLTGGNKESGVFAARYRITGRDGKADVSVNPLSILTPGFLRNLFDIFDQPKDGPTKPEKDE